MPDAIRPKIRAASRRATPALAVVSLLSAAALTACGGGGAGAGPAMGGGMPPPQVGVVSVQPADVAVQAELPGRLEAWRTAQVRARVAGVVQARLFTEGGSVKAGQSLFRIDAAAYQAALDNAQAALSRAEAQRDQAQATFERNRPLAEAKAISQTEWVATQTALKQSLADVAAARAAVATARLNLEYAAVRAPISGRIGRALVTEGALVGQGDATQLALIQQTDRLYVNFTQSAAEAMKLRRAFESGQLRRAGQGAAVQVVLEDGTVHSAPGKLLFSDLSVDPGTGQVTLRAEVPNPDGTLLPGLYVKVRLALAEVPAGVNLPQQAVTRSPSGDTVLVVGADGMPAPRRVTVAGASGNQWVITDGLKAGEQVIVDGFQKMRPKSPVTPVPWSPAGAAAPAAPAAAPAASAAASAPRA
jgi:membrane fusion protein (multidrug efflux system)